MPNGRKAQYADWLKEEGLLLIKGWARDGFTDKQIAKLIGVSESTFSDWKRRFPAITETIKKGRQPICYEVEEALYSRCKWKKVTEVVRKYTVDADGNMTGKMRIEEYDKWIAPDTTAIIFASKNLMPGKFSDKPKAAPIEGVEDDGLISALKGSVEHLFAEGDDSAMVTK